MRGLKTTTALALIAGGAAFAATDAAAQSGGLDQIVVTARKKEESLQDVPIAITVATQEQITERNIQSINDLQAITPGLVLSGQYSNTPLVSISGQGG